FRILVYSSRLSVRRNDREGQAVMFFQIFGYAFGLFMAVHYYVFLVFLPALIDSFLDDN
ncbi:MAG: hypothetical protein ACD_39C01213G0001, partial [uncultured bacterium]